MIIISIEELGIKSSKCKLNNETIEIPDSELLNIVRYTISVNGTHVYCRGVPEDRQRAISIYERLGLTDGLDTMKKYLKRQSELSEANRSIGL